MADSKGVKQAPWTLRHGPLLNNGAVDPFHAGHRESSVLIRSGAMLAAPSLGRPLVQNLKTNRTSPLSNGDRVDSIMDWEDSGGRCTTGVRAIQDTTRWDTVHRDGINVLMADGSVKAVAWQAVPDSTQASNFPSGRNRDERMSSGSGAPQGEWRELPPERVFGGLFVKSYRKRIQWED